MWTIGFNKTSNSAVQTDTNDFERSVAPRLRDVVCTSRTRNNRRGSTVFRGMFKQPIKRSDRDIVVTEAVKRFNILRFSYCNGHVYVTERKNT